MVFRGQERKRMLTQLEYERDRRHGSSIARKFPRLDDTDGDESKEEESIVSFDTEITHDNIIAEPLSIVCMNCHRRSYDEVDSFGYLDFLYTEPKDIHFRRKWCLFKKKETEGKVPLCFPCEECLTSNVPRVQLEPSSIWPAFIWQIITDSIKDSPGDFAVWRLLPDSWRPWWLDEARRCGLSEVSLDHPRSMVVDVTDARKHFVNARSDLGEVGWAEISEIIESSLTIPSVRCPWGCGEFLGRTNHLPLDVFWKRYLDVVIPYSKASELACNRGFREDLLSKEACILGNKKWKCMPSVAFIDGYGPRILICRYHSNRDQFDYIHPTGNPTGSLSFEGDNALAQVMAVPRTVRSFQPKAYSHSYQLNKVMGNYSGMDSLNLTTQSMYENRRSVVSFRRDQLAVLGPPDYRAFICTRHKADKFVTKRMTRNFLETADQLVPPSDREEFQAKFRQGGTFIRMQDVFEHIQLMQRSARMISVFDEETGQTRMITFTPRWPEQLLTVRLSGNEYGSEFTMFSGFNDCFVSWLVTNICHMIPEVWASVNINVVDNRGWEGWMLTFLHSVILSSRYRSVRVRGENPFTVKGLSAKKMQEKLGQYVVEGIPSLQPNIVTESLRNLFARNQSVRVVENYPVQEEEIESASIVFLVYNVFVTTSVEIRNVMFGHELRLVAIKGAVNEKKKEYDIMYVRHGGTCSKFWLCTHARRRDGQIRKCKEDFFNTIRADWNVLVFVKQTRPDYEKIRSSMIELQYGQSLVRCKAHMCPLVVALPSTSRKDNCYHGDGQSCLRKCYYRCPKHSCSLGVCRQHMEEFKHRGEVIHLERSVRLSNHRGTDYVRIDDTLNDVERRGDVPNDVRSHVSDNSDETVSFGITSDTSVDSSDEYSLGSGSSNGEEGIVDNFNLEFDAESDSFNLEFDTESEQEDEDVRDDLIMWAAEDFDEGLGNVSGMDDESCSGEEGLNVEDVMRIPATNIGRKGIGYDISQLAKEGKLIPDYVLLNTCGNLLQRRNQKLRGNQANRNFLQGIVATAQGEQVPLLYPEAMLFPDAFWTSDLDGSVDGAIPVSLLQDDQSLNHLGVASLYHHCRTRMLDPTLSLSTSHKYMAFSWDMVANLGLRGENAQLVLRRGFADVVGNEGLKMRDKDEPVYDSYCIDSRATVNQIAAANGKTASDLFFTWTANQKQTVGLRLIFAWTESEEALENFILEFPFAGQFDEMERHLLQEAFMISAGISMLRAWMELVEIFLEYLQFGKDSPFRNVCGGIKDVWNRLEIQSEEDAKLPHAHTLLYFKEHPKNEQEAFPILQLIRGSIETFATDEEKDELLEKGFIKDPDLMIGFLQDFKRKVAHHCTKRCQVLVRRRATDGTTIMTRERLCKVPDNRKMNPSPTVHSFVPINVNHSQEALRCMVLLGLIEEAYQPYTSVLQCVPKEGYQHFLESKRHVPPCYGTDGPSSPANVFLFAMLLASMNVQYCTSYILLRYLAKYVASVDKASKMVLKAGRGDDEIVATAVTGYNTKITGNQIAENQAQGKQKDNFRIEGRNISLAEIAMQFLQYKTIRTTFNFEYIPTQPMGLRPVLKMAPFIKRLKKVGDASPDARRVQDLDASKVFPGYRSRNDLSLLGERQYDRFQVISYLDSVFQPGAVDRVTVFGLRPPELRWVKRITVYYTLFTRESLSGYHGKDCDYQTEYLKRILHKKYNRCPWIDGMGFRVRVRAAGVAKLLQYCENRSLSEEVILLLKQLLCWMDPEMDYGRRTRGNDVKNRDAAEMFLTEGTQPRQSRIPIYWFRTAKPSQSENFLYHLLLSLGEYNTELELLCQGSMVKSFIHAGLFTSSNDPQERDESVKNLVRRYISSQLSHYPAGTKTFDYQLVTAYRLLQDFLLRGIIVSDSLPAPLFTRLRQQCLEEVETCCLGSQQALVSSFLVQSHKIYSSAILPSYEDIMGATFDEPCNFDLLNLPRGELQPEASYVEHQEGFKKVVDMVRHYKRASNERTKSLVLVGGGGVAKTTDMRTAGLYCQCQGLFVLTTTLTGKRSAEIVGEHLHLRFKLTINEALTAGQMAERAVGNLLKDPKRWELLRRMDVMLIDELGQIDAKLLSVLDIILRRVRKSTHWFGGILVIATMDVRQLKPIRGLPPILCPAMLSSFVYHRYCVSLRTLDPALQKIQKITRMSAAELKKDGIREDFCKLLQDNCNFVDSMNDIRIPERAVYCFGRHAPCRRAEAEVLRKVKGKYSNRLTTRRSIDWEETKLQSHPVMASTATSLTLDRKMKNPRELILFPYGVYELTYNDPKGKFFQSQLCILLDTVPAQNDLDSWNDIEVYRAPHGVDEIPVLPVSQEELLQLGWVKVTLGRAPERRQNLGNHGLNGWREQYGLKYRIALTIHSVMGSTIPVMVTQVGIGKEESLWEAAQVVVLLSRTRFAKDIYFIGNAGEVAEVLFEALLRGDQYGEYVAYLLDTLCNGATSEDGFTIDQTREVNPFRPKDSSLPFANEHCCYFLVSLADTSVSYIGRSSNLRKRLNTHNSERGGSSFTDRQHLKPWGLLGYVVGFDSGHQMNRFESSWQLLVDSEQYRAHGSLSATAKMNLAGRLMSSTEWNGQLRLIICGSVE